MCAYKYFGFNFFFLYILCLSLHCIFHVYLGFLRQTKFSQLQGNPECLSGCWWAGCWKKATTTSSSPFLSAFSNNTGSHIQTRTLLLAFAAEHTRKTLSHTHTSHLSRKSVLWLDASRWKKNTSQSSISSILVCIYAEFMLILLGKVVSSPRH